MQTRALIARLGGFVLFRGQGPSWFRVPPSWSWCLDRCRETECLSHGVRGLACCHHLARPSPSTTRFEPKALWRLSCRLAPPRSPVVVAETSSNLRSDPCLVVRGLGVFRAEPTKPARLEGFLARSCRLRASSGLANNGLQLASAGMSGLDLEPRSVMRLQLKPRALARRRHRKSNRRIVAQSC